MATVPELSEGERIDDLGVQGWCIIQHEDEFRFSLDAVLLAHFATLRPHARIVDLGCGGGAVALFLLSRGADTVDGIELNPRLAAMAERTAKLNGLSGRLKVFCGDVGQIKTYAAAGSQDLVVANPPYRMSTSGRVSPTAGVALARHESGAGLREFVRAHTTVNPMAPTRARRLVTSGVFSRTRNPMYLGMLLVLAGWGVWLGNAVAWLGLPLFVAVLNVLQIRPEERAMRQRFGAEFERYAARVRRWI